MLRIELHAQFVVTTAVWGSDTPLTIRLPSWDWMWVRGGRDQRGRSVQASDRQHETVPTYAKHLGVLNRPIRAGQHKAVPDLCDLTTVRAGGE